MARMRNTLRLLLLLLALPCCAAAAREPSLYARLGGAPVVAAVVADTIDGVAADPRLNQSFKGTNLRRVKEKLAEQLCQLTGGGCTYTGDSMREVHAGHHIGEAEFYGLVDQLQHALRHHGVRLRERNELLALLAPMKRDVVNVPVPPPSGPPTTAEER